MLTSDVGSSSLRAFGKNMLTSLKLLTVSVSVLVSGLKFKNSGNTGQVSV